VRYRCKFGGGVPLMGTAPAAVLGEGCAASGQGRSRSCGWSSVQVLRLVRWWQGRRVREESKTSENTLA